MMLKKYPEFYFESYYKPRHAYLPAGGYLLYKFEYPALIIIICNRFWSWLETRPETTRKPGFCPGTAPSGLVMVRVADPHHFKSDLGPAFHFNADLDQVPAFHFLSISLLLIDARWI
jgi:hypothetical protein